MSNDYNNEIKESILDNLDQTHPKEWQAYKQGRSTLGDIYDLVQNIFNNEAQWLLKALENL